MSLCVRVCVELCGPLSLSQRRRPPRWLASQQFDLQAPRVTLKPEPRGGCLLLARARVWASGPALVAHSRSSTLLASSPAH